ncbi:hypothetical protein [Arthrobacter sp. 92]|uniref:hypothetical protein n=1 Tax=Arthrobacter sp. 92 TaxID=3418175 RepID=UPI003D01A6F0
MSFNAHVLHSRSAVHTAAGPIRSHFGTTARIGNWPDPMRARIGNWPDPMRARIGNWPDPMRARIGNWPDPMRPAAAEARG